MKTRERMTRHIESLEDFALSDKDVEQLYLFTENNLSDERKRELANSTSYWVRIELAERHDLPLDVAMKLAADEDLGVREVLSEHIQFPEAQKLLATSKEMLAELHLNPNLIEELKAPAKEAYTELLFKGMANDCTSLIRQSLGLPPETKEVSDQ